MRAAAYFQLYQAHSTLRTLKLLFIRAVFWVLWDGTERLQPPFAVPLFVEWPLVGWNWALQKNSFSAHACTASSPLKINMFKPVCESLRHPHLSMIMIDPRPTHTRIWTQGLRVWRTLAFLFPIWKVVFLALTLWDSEMRCCNSYFSVPGPTHQTSPAWQNKQFVRLWNSNYTSLPRLTSL